jgi:hypothetical protein
MSDQNWNKMSAGGGGGGLILGDRQASGMLENSSDSRLTDSALPRSSQDFND